MKLRRNNLQKLSDGVFDVLIVGGGINGAVSAAALSARGARVALIDRGDFAGETSQASSNLAWGGIKYLESQELGLVRKLCLSRNRLMRAYPSTVQEIRFFVAIQRGFRHSRLLVWLGCWLYWFFGNMFTRRPRLLSRKLMAEQEPIVSLGDSEGGLEYSDAYLHDTDARFVFNFVRSAMSYGCVAANYVESRGGSRGPTGLWSIAAHDLEDSRDLVIRARIVINACGPWADAHNALLGEETKHHHLFSKGIHLVVRRLTPNKRVLTFFADDGRLFFVIPMGPRTCIGTTDTRCEGPGSSVTAADRRFVLDNINKRLELERPLTEADIIAERCGVRPLVAGCGENGTADWLQLSRKHVIEVDAKGAYLSIFGGKLTDCLNVGDEVCAITGRLGLVLPFPGRCWYGEPAEQIREEFFHQAQLMHLDALTSPSSSEPLSVRLWRRYGGQAIGLLENIRADPRQAEVLIAGAEYLRCEIEQAGQREMITKLDDFLRRRSKIALVTRQEDLARAAGLAEACRILFAERADEKLAEYFAGAALSDDERPVIRRA